MDLHVICRNYPVRGSKSTFLWTLVHIESGGFAMNVDPIDLTVELRSYKLLKSLRKIENEDLEREILEGVVDLIRSFVEGCSHCESVFQEYE